MLRLHGVSKQFGPRPILRHISLVVHAGETIALVGGNGSGKSTLLRIAAGDLAPDAGSIAVAPGRRVAWLQQEVVARAGATVGERFPVLYPDAAAGALAAAAIRLGKGEAAAAEYERMLDIVSRAGARAAGDAGDARQALGVASVEAGMPLDALSGGERAKLALAEALASDADVLLLDEPTNHLDLPAIRWLEARLAAFEGAVLLVSHDRALLDRVADRLFILATETGEAEAFAGNYSAWSMELARRNAAQREAYGRQQRADRRLREHLAQLESRSRYIENSTINFAIRKKAKKIARRSTTLKRRLEREAASGERVERPREAAGGIRAAFTAGERSGTRVVELHRASLRAGGRTLLAEASAVVTRGDRIALIGPNGSGKTTILRAILGEVVPASGAIHVAPTGVIGYLAQTDALDEWQDLTPVEVARRESGASTVEAANFAHRLLPGHDPATTPVLQLSYGERRRLALGLLMLQGVNLLLLDEPTNHLDMDACEAIEATLESFAGTVIAVTHDRRFIASVADRVWSIEGERLVERAPEPGMSDAREAATS